MKAESQLNKANLLSNMTDVRSRQESGQDPVLRLKQSQINFYNNSEEKSFQGQEALLIRENKGDYSNKEIDNSISV